MDIILYRRHIILILLAVLDISLSINCSSPIGTENESALTSAAREHSFYLNTARPALCSGTVKRWRYCYYTPNVNSDGSTDVRYRTSFAVYRRMTGEPAGAQPNDIEYRRVSGVSSIVIQDYEVNDFVCDVLEVDPFEIEAGDIVGACIFDPIDSQSRTREQLDIVGEVRDSLGSLLRMTDVSACSVGLNRLPLTVSVGILSEINSRILHLHANIESKF